MTMIAVAIVSLRVGQWTLRGLDADLADEFAGGDFGHFRFRLADRKVPRGPFGPAGLAVT